MEMIESCRAPLVKANSRKILVALASGLLLISVGLIYIFTVQRPPDLSQAICQPGDLGERYHPFDRLPTVTNPYLGETVVASYTIELVDLQLTYTMLGCSIIRYADETVAHRAFEKVCANRTEQTDLNLEVGDEACAFAGSAPRNLAFRRHEFLVLMRGDVRGFPATAVDKRLR
jgi:hypothetical protein